MRTKSAILISAILAAATVTGCSSTVEPFASQSGQKAYSVFGYLDTARDTQFVRIQALRDTPDPRDGIASEVSVVVRPLGGGAGVAFADTIVTLDNGTKASLFYAPMRVLSGGSYELVVEDGQPEALRAVTTIPERPAIIIGEEQIFGGSVRQEITISELRKRPTRSEIGYRLKIGFQETPGEGRISYTDAGSQTVEGWAIVIDPVGDQPAVRSQLGIPEGPPLPIFDEVVLRYELLSTEWQTPDDPAHVVNGFGFFGSVGRFEESWMLSDNIIRLMGYRPN